VDNLSVNLLHPTRINIPVLLWNLSPCLPRRN
jgi:hypothetical protein